MEYIPQEIFCVISSFLSLYDYRSFATTCKRVRNSTIVDSHLWCELVKRHWPFDPVIQTANSETMSAHELKSLCDYTETKQDEREEIMGLIENAWNSRVYDMRFGQFLCNFFTNFDQPDTEINQGTSQILKELVCESRFRQEETSRPRLRIVILCDILRQVWKATPSVAASNFLKQFFFPYVSSNMGYIFNIEDSKTIMCALSILWKRSLQNDLCCSVELTVFDALNQDSTQIGGCIMSNFPLSKKSASVFVLGRALGNLNKNWFNLDNMRIQISRENKNLVKDAMFDGLIDKKRTFGLSSLYNHKVAQTSSEIEEKPESDRFEVISKTKEESKSHSFRVIEKKQGLEDTNIDLFALMLCSVSGTNEKRFKLEKIIYGFNLSVLGSYAQWGW